MKKDQIVASTLIFYLLLISCSIEETKNQVIDLSKVETIIPKELIRFDKVDSLYFGYVGINSFAFDDGSFVLPVWDPTSFVKISEDGGKVLAKTLKGRGPGELLDIGTPTWDGEDQVYVYDQFQKKIVLYNTDLNLVREFVVKLDNGWRAIRIFPELQEGKYVVEGGPRSFKVAEMDKKRVYVYDLNSEETERKLDLYSHPYIPLGDLINGGSGSAMQLPFGNDQFIVYKPDSKTLLLFDTRTDLIAEININFDTLRTIPVNIPKEELTASEIDDMEKIEKKDGMRNSDWLRIEEALPEFKAQAKDMIYHKQKIWLKTHLKSDYDKWLVINMKGEIVKVVNLPKNSFLTHVSEHHLGIRLDDSTFGLFEAVE
ncbi:MAG: hypothetical protein ABJK11_07355 [Balneola sp.]